MTFPVADLEPLIPIKVYGKKFLAPNNSEVYLEKIFGKSWGTPDKKQFFWNKNKFK
jgi:phosphorylcholine metabolism protein LicD